MHIKRLYYPVLEIHKLLENILNHSLFLYKFQFYTLLPQLIQFKLGYVLLFLGNFPLPIQV